MLNPINNCGSKHKNHNNTSLHIYSKFGYWQKLKACPVKDVEGLELSHTADRNVTLYKTVELFKKVL